MRRLAFSIIELLVVISILGLLFSMATLSIGRAQRNSRDSRRLADILLIGKAVDQYALINRGSYPSLSSGSNIGCVTQLSGLDLSGFPGQIIPTDPRPANAINTNCSNRMLDGYTYERYAPLDSNNYATQQKVRYALEVGLEDNPTPPAGFQSDDTTSINPNPGHTIRNGFVFNGPYCDPNCPTN